MKTAAALIAHLEVGGLIARGDPLWNVQASALKLAVDALESLTLDQVEEK